VVVALVVHDDPAQPTSQSASLCPINTSSRYSSSVTVVPTRNAAESNEIHTALSTMREAAVIPGAPLTASLGEELGASFGDDNNNGVSVIAEQASMFHTGMSLPASNGLENSPSFPSGFAPYSMSDDEGGMSSDGGVQLNMSAAHSEALNVEMDMVDAEVMGHFNLASIVESHGFLNDEVDDTAHFSIEEEESQIVPHPWTLDDDFLAITHQIPEISNLPDVMSEVSQQLQYIQDGQEQGELSIVQHGSVHDQSIHPIPFITSILSSHISTSGTHNSNTAAMPVAPAFSVAESSGVLTSQLAVDSQAAVDIVHGVQHGAWSIPSSLVDEFVDESDVDTVNAPQTNNAQVEDTQNNLPLADFLYSWSVNVGRDSRKPNRGPRLDSVRELRAKKPVEVRISDLRGEKCDIQGINWKKLDVKRHDARSMRIATYRNYQSLSPPHWLPLTLRRTAIQDDNEDFFKFRHMNFKYKINLAHFQLRNLVACTSRNNVFYAGESRVFQTNPIYGQKLTKMNLSEPEVQPTHGYPWAGVQISTIAADHNVLIAGGFHGEYGMMPLDQPDAKHVEGLVVDHPNCITNHIQIQINRQSGLPEAIIASNDHVIRTLDCTTNQFVKHHEYKQAINCTAQSPDRRLRVLVGDTCDVMIANAETGEVLQGLSGHLDYGFACAWADNGWHVASGNQDRLVKIWDARMWTTSDGTGKPLATISSTMAGVRSLKYSPLGSGKRVLLAAEPADIISVIDAETYKSKQTLDLFGEIAGTDFSPDGQDIFVGVHDNLRGGIMEFQKCGFGRSYEHESIFRNRERDVDMYGSKTDDENLKEMAAGLDWKRDAKEVVAGSRSRRTSTHRRRRAARLGDMDPY